MKKLFTFVCLLCTITALGMPAEALSVGTYKTESEYGLLDGFKFNWKRTDKSQPFIEPRDESSKSEKEKDYRNYAQTEYERTKYMYEGKAIL